MVNSVSLPLDVVEYRWVQGRVIEGTPECLATAARSQQESKFIPSHRGRFLKFALNYEILFFFVLVYYTLQYIYGGWDTSSLI